MGYNALRCHQGWKKVMCMNTVRQQISSTNRFGEGGGRQEGLSAVSKVRGAENWYLSWFRSTTADVFFIIVIINTTVL